MSKYKLNFYKLILLIAAFSLLLFAACTTDVRFSSSKGLTNNATTEKTNL